MLPDAAQGWFKQLTNGTFIDGCDYAVDRQQVSWSRTPTFIIYAQVYDCITNLCGRIRGLGEYWQSDDFIVPMKVNTTQSGKRQLRRIQRVLTPQDKFLYIKEESKLLEISVEKELTNKPDCKIIVVEPGWYNKWLTIEINKPNQTLTWSIAPNKI
jgi:hypothetical protein